MKPWGWLASAGLLFAVLVAVESRPALRELSANREWRLIDASPDGASMDGLRLAVQTQVAAIAAPKPDRAALLIRLNMQVTPAARRAWQDCRVSLRGSDGQIWMPVTNASSDGAVKFLSPDGKNFGLCRLYSRDGHEGAETVLADQLFLLPVDSLQGLRLHISGIGTRPRALSMAIAPAIKHLP